MPSPFLPQVVVGNLVFRVGYLLYVNEQLAHQHAVLVTSLLAAGLAALLALWAAVVWWQRRRLARRQAYRKAPPDAKLSISVESGDSEETEGSGQSEGSRGSSGADDSFYTGRGSSGTSGRWTGNEHCKGLVLYALICITISRPEANHFQCEF